MFGAQTLIVPMTWDAEKELAFPETYKLAVNRANINRAGKALDELATGPKLCERHDHDEACYNGDRGALSCGYITGQFAPVDDSVSQFMGRQLGHQVDLEAFRAEQIILWRMGVPGAL